MEGQAEGSPHPSCSAEGHCQARPVLIPPFGKSRRQTVGGGTELEMAQSFC